MKPDDERAAFTVRKTGGGAVAVQPAVAIAAGFKGSRDTLNLGIRVIRISEIDFALGAVVNLLKLLGGRHVVTLGIRIHRATG